MLKRAAAGEVVGGRWEGERARGWAGAGALLLRRQKSTVLRKQRLTHARGQGERGGQIVEPPSALLRSPGPRGAGDAIARQLGERVEAACGRRR